MLTTVKHLPTEFGLQSLFDDLFVPNVEVRPADIHLSALRPFLLASYVDANGSVEALALCDINLATILGAALSMQPIGCIREDLDAREIRDEIADNAREVFNIASNLFQAGAEQRHRLDEFVTWKNVDEKLMSVARSRLPKRTFAIEVEQYGIGKVTYMALTEECKSSMAQ
jgi:hypothetical protein